MRATCSMIMGLVLLALAGCGGADGEPEPTGGDSVAANGAPEPTSGKSVPAGVDTQLDSAALEMALSNQAKFEAGGFHLVGRAWFATDAYGEIYESTQKAPPTAVAAEAIGSQDPGNRVVSFTARGNSPLATRIDLRPVGNETVEAYVARTRPQGSPGTRFDAKTGNALEQGGDWLLFAPAPAPAEPRTTKGDEQGTTVQGLNEFCPIDNFNYMCSNTYGYRGDYVLDYPVNNWYVLDRPATTFSGTGTSAYGVACADAGNMTLKFSRAGAVVLTIDINQGWFNYSAAWSGWRDEEYCSSHVLGVCVNHAWRVRFTHEAYAVSISFKTTGGGIIGGVQLAIYNGHFCGSIRNIDDEYHSDPCSRNLICPGTGWINLPWGQSP